MLPRTSLSTEGDDKRAYWKTHIEAWQESGSTAKAYCQKNSLSIPQFKYWQYRLAPETKRKSSNQQRVKRPAISFMELTSEPVEHSDNIIMSNLALKLHFANGTDMEVYQALPFEQLLKLIEQLG